MTEQFCSTDSQLGLARDHSLLLEERLNGVFRTTSVNGPSSFAGLVQGHQGHQQVNVYATLAGADEEDGGQPRDLRRYVSNLSRALPEGVQLEHKLHLEVVHVPAQPRPAKPRAVQQQPADTRLGGWLDLDAGRRPAAANQHARQQQAQEQPQPQPQQQQQAAKQAQPPRGSVSPGVADAQAEPVPGKPLRIKLRIPRSASEQRLTPGAGGAPRHHGATQDPQQLMAAVRQLGADPLLSPIPASWAEAVQLSPLGNAGAVVAAAAAASPSPPPQQEQQLGSPPAWARNGPKPERRPSPFASASPDGSGQTKVLDAPPEPRQQQPAPAPAPLQEQQQQQQAPLQRTPSAPQPSQGTKRPAQAAAARVPPARSTSLPGLEAPQPGEAPQQQLKRQRSGNMPGAFAAAGAAAPAPPQPAAAPADGLAALAALLPAALSGAGAHGAVPPSSAVHELQQEGKKLKKFAEKRIKDGKPTHVSSMFLCQSCVKFLEVAAAMEAHPAKFSRESTASMYSQTAGLLDSCAHNAGRAEGPAAITQAISLLAQRLAAIARLRAAYCLRAEGVQQATAFRAALEKGSGETYQRPSPTDSNTSTSISLPVEAGGAARPGAVTPQQPLAAPKPPTGASAATPPTELAAAPLVGMPKALLERQLAAGRAQQDVLASLAAFAKSAERLREYMGEAAQQGSAQGLRVAAATLLLSADAGMGPTTSILSLAKEALGAIMAM